MGAAGVLEFTLGLEASNFLNKIGVASGELLAFIGIGKTLHQVIEGTWAAIERGAALEHLSKRTGETVGNLYLLEKGLKAVGLDSGAAGTMLFQMNKALGGVNEMGEPTSHIFEQLGLSIDDLKSKSAPEALAKIFASLNQFDNASATFAAGKIFGRGGAQDALQAARSSKDFSSALSSNKEGAAQAERTAEAFKKIAMVINSLKGKVNSIFTGIAEAAAPEIEKVLDLIKDINFTKIGEQLGDILKAFIQSFREGNLAEIISETVSTGFRIAWAVVPVLFQGLGNLLIHVFEEPLNYLQAGMTYVFNNLVASLPDSVKKLFGMEGATRASFKEIMEEQRRTGVQFNLAGFYGLGPDEQFGLKEMDSDFAARLKEAYESARGDFKSFMDKVHEINARAPKPEADKKKAETERPKRTLNTNEDKEKIKKPNENLTSLEKIGFHISSGVGGLAGHNDPAKTTAANTQIMARALTRIENHLTKKADQPYARK